MTDFDIELTEGEGKPTTRGSRPASPPSPSVSPKPEPLDAEGIPLDAPKGKVSIRNTPVRTCSRWMFHRKDVYCKECGKVGK